MTYPVPDNESERLAALEHLNILDTEDEEVFDRIAEVTRQIFNVENSAVSLVSDERQWFKAACGWDMQETSRDMSLCAHAIVEQEVLVIEDITADPRFADHPLVERGTDIRFYAGAPLEVSQNLFIGTLCVADPEARSFTSEDRTLLSRLAGFVSDLLDMRRQARKATYLGSALEQVDESILITEAEPLDPPGPRIRWVNEACAKMTGYDRDELLGNTPRILQGPRTDGAVLDEVRAALEAEESSRAETVNYRKDGEPYVASWVVTPVRGPNGDLTHWVSVQRDRTDEHEREQRLEYEALHDDLTGVLRRTAIEGRMQDALDTGAPDAGGLLFMDLDRFKWVNDSLGHNAGDQLLRAVAQTLQRVTRSGDEVARFGGDEFVVWLTGDDTEAPGQVAERILEAFQQPFTIEGEEIYAEMSIGIVPRIDAYETAESVLRNADTAMYRAKEVPGPSSAVHESDMGADATERLRLDTALHQAVEQEAFEPFFHPIIRLDDGTLHGYEVLARWRRADGTVVSPGRFLDVAEEAGLITSIGHQVIEGACQVLHDLRKHHGHDPKVALSANFSRAEFFRPDTRTFVQTMLDRYGIEPSHFTMEVTERAVGNGKMQDLTEIRRLKALGVRIEIDDFGTGYSSLMSLLDFPVDGLKFDKDMTEQLDGGGPGRAMVQSVLEMADRLGLSVTAEGIETDEQLDALRNLDCAYGQGYLFTRPVPAQSLHTLLDEAPWRTYWD